MIETQNSVTKAKARRLTRNRPTPRAAPANPRRSASYDESQVARRSMKLSGAAGKPFTAFVVARCASIQ